MQTTRIASSFSLYRLIDNRNIYSIFSENPRMLAFWSHQVEKEVINARLYTDVYAGFQLLSRARNVLTRYQHMARQAQRVWLFGVNDDGLEGFDGLTPVTLTPAHQLANEWFLIVNHDDYARALVAQEVTPPGTPQSERRFEGVMIGDRQVISRLEDALRAALGMT